MMPDREKVIEGLKCCFENAKCDGCPYEMECRKILFKTKENHCPILDDILAILKEQEPVHPIKQYDGNPGDWASWWYVCGNCERDIDCYDKFCRSCGRAVKWE